MARAVAVERVASVTSAVATEPVASTKTTVVERVTRATVPVSRSADEHRIPDPADAGGDAGAAAGLLVAEQAKPTQPARPVRRDDERPRPNGKPTHGSKLDSLPERNEGTPAANGHADAGGDAAAATNLGVRLEQQGDLDGALAAYRRADERGDANGSFNLGCLLAQLGDIAAAVAALRRADMRGDAAAASNLGFLLEQQGDPDGALDAYIRADQRGDAKGSFNLGLLLASHGDRAGAEQAFHRAEELGDPDLVKRARVALDQLKPWRLAGMRTAAKSLVR